MGIFFVLFKKLLFLQLFNQIEIHVKNEDWSISKMNVFKNKIKKIMKKLKKLKQRVQKSKIEKWFKIISPFLVQLVHVICRLIFDN
jgi:hypothetical protein